MNAQSFSKSIGIDYSKKKHIEYYLYSNDTTGLYSNKRTENISLIELSYAMKYSNLYEYGISVNFHTKGTLSASLQNKLFLTPFVLKNKHSRIDIFIPFSVEWYYNRNTYNIFKKDFHINNASIGIGSSVSLTKKISTQLIISKDYSPFTNVYTYPYFQFGISYNWGKTKDE